MSIVLFVGSNFVGNVGEIMNNAILSIGIQIAFYYTLAGVAVVVAYRKVLLKSVKNFILIGLWPAAGAVFMGVMFVMGIVQNFQDDAIVVNILGLGLIVLGVVPIALFYRKARGYYTRRPLELPDELDAAAPANVDDRDPAAR